MIVAVAIACWRALGTSVEVLVTDPGGLDAARAAVASVLEQVDATYSRFRPDSELNRAAAHGGGPVRVSPLLARAVAAALRAAELTDGSVDPTVGRAMRAIGYDLDFALIGRRPAPPTVTIESIPGWRTVRLDPVARTLMTAPGVELDLGSTGKALAADLAAQAATEASAGAGVLVNLGGDIGLAGTAPVGGWRVLLADDASTSPNAEGEVVSIVAGGVATSSTTVRRWRDGAVERHHIIDPATGAPANGPWRTVTVAAADCVEANAAATATIVLGQRAIEWLGDLGLPARLVSTAGAVHRLGGWPLPATPAPRRHAPAADAGRPTHPIRSVPTSLEALS